MASAGLLALLDDIATLLDDAALLTRVATKKTAGVIGDDLALNAEQVVGMRADRELPVVWAVAKGALLNKVILVPAFLAISAFLPWLVTPLLMIGGAFLCYEGFEKVWHKLHAPTPADTAARAARIQAVANPDVDIVAFEQERIKGAIRTDFILSAEIVVIALGTMRTAPIAQQIAALSAIGVGITAGVYGLVAGLVKLDDLGLRLQQTPGTASLGGFLLRATPLLMKGLSILGTAAMFLVGGAIIAHGIPPVEHFVAGLVSMVTAAVPALSGITRMLLDGVVGIVVGGVIVTLLSVFKRAPSPTTAAPSA
jgi:uncharacterized protein